MNTVTKQEAIQTNSKFYFTGNPCQCGHISKRYVKGSTCFECSQLADKKYRKNNKPLVKQRQTLWMEEHPLYQKNWRKDNPDYNAEWLHNNPDYNIQYLARYYRQYKHKSLASSKKWRQRNPHKVVEYVKNRNGYIKIAKPKWANDTLIKQMYEKRNQLTKQTGIPHQVDHIIPLRGKYVCGLHCEDNLQVLTSTENLLKRNYFDV